MDILSFLQAQWISRRTILWLLQEWKVHKNNVPISFRKENISQWDTIVVLYNDMPKEYIVNTPEEDYKIILFNKPLGYVTSKSDIHNNTIYDILPEDWSKSFYYIWRLDKDSHGLTVLTNASKLVDFYSHPRNQHKKIYRIITNREMHEDDRNKWISWVVYYDKDTWKSEKLSRDSCEQSITWTNSYIITIHEWKKRHIRRLCEVLWYRVIDLKRETFGPWSLENIPEWERIIKTFSASDLESLLENWNSYKQKQI